MGGVDNRDPTEDYNNLREELRLYKAELDDSPYLVVANKMDVPEAELYLEEFRKATGEAPLLMTASTGEGVDILKQLLYEKLVKRKPDAT